MKTIFKLLCIALLGIVLAQNADSAMCGGGTCNEPSKHPASSVSIVNGVGGTIWYSNVSEADYSAIAVAACDYYAAAHNGTMTSCVPLLPLAAGSTGGSGSPISVGGYFNGSYGVWNMISFGCSDTLNINSVATGTDGQCYCIHPLMYSSQMNACISGRDWFKPRTPKDSSINACSEGPTPHPLYPLTGSKSLTRDLGVVIGKETLTLFYDTRGKNIDASSTATINGQRGPAIAHAKSFDGMWFSSLHRSLNLQRRGIGTVGFIAQAIRSDGQIVTFDHPSATSYNPVANGVVIKLTPELNGGDPTNRLFLTDKAGNIETYDTYGITTAMTADLVRIDYVDGGYVNFTYANRLLTRATDQTGRTVRFQYNTVGSGSRITKITTPDGRFIAFAYDANQMLEQITWPDGKTLQYLHENASFPWAVTGVVDENSSRLFTFGYDAQGRAVDSKYANGAEHYAVSYGTPPTLSVSEVWDGTYRVMNRYYNWTPPQGVSITGPDGVSSAVGSTAVNGMNLVSSKSQPAGSGCAASSNASTYDAVGNVLSQDDFQGQRSCFSYDSNNRETVRVEGLANTVNCATVLPANAALPSDSRKITTTWHPDWRLPVRTSAPGSVTTNIYQGQVDAFSGGALANCTPAAALPNDKPTPLLCKQVVRATTDVDGSLGLAALIDTNVMQQTSSFTYDSQGRRLTSTDPLGRITAYTYYSNSTDFSDYAVDSDASFDSVSLLLHGDGDGIYNPTAITDSSSAARPVTVGGNAKASTIHSKFGGASLAFGGSVDFAAVAGASSFAFGTGDFTIELFIRTASDKGGLVLQPITLGWGLLLYGGNLYFQRAYNAQTLLTVIAPPIFDSTWHHIAVTRSGGINRIFIDGIAQGSAVLDSTNYAVTGPVRIGHSPAALQYFTGNLDEVRITKGVARYTANFTPPTQAFPDTNIPALDPNAVGHRTGDLQSVTNAAGHVTQYTLFDGAGRVRQMIDPKGMVTDTTYTPRGWIASTTVTPPGGVARTTAYTYDNAGQLTGVVMPDATTLSYSYDAAHRLIGVTDTKGNTVTYTLDNMGNKVGEQVKDPQGNLQRSITRVYDALNRVQQTTGASN